MKRVLTGLVLAAVTTAQLPAQGFADEDTEKMAFYCAGFGRGSKIPKAYTEDGEDYSPQMMWKNLPEGTESLLLICDDPDAPKGTWLHWLVYDINPALGGLPRGVSQEPAEVPGKYTQGVNSWKRVGYNGPAPPRGQPHRYLFKLFALDVKLNLPKAASLVRVLRAAKGHVIGKAAVVGTYQRKPHRRY